MTAPIPDGQITVKDLLLELKALREDLVKVLTHMERVDTRNLSADSLHIDHETRLRALEKWRYAFPVALMLAAISAAAVVAQVVASRR